MNSSLESAVPLRVTRVTHRHLLPVLPALHQCASGSRLGGLPRVAGSDSAAGLPRSPRATERDLLPAHEADQSPPASEVLSHAGEHALGFNWLEPFVRAG